MTNTVENFLRTKPPLHLPQPDPKFRPSIEMITDRAATRAELWKRVEKAMVSKHVFWHPAAWHTGQRSSFPSMCSSTWKQSRASINKTVMTFRKASTSRAEQQKVVGGQPWQAAAPKKFLPPRGSRNQIFCSFDPFFLTNKHELVLISLIKKRGYKSG